jgi:hypothetical protein
VVTAIRSRPARLPTVSGTKNLQKSENSSA